MDTEKGWEPLNRIELTDEQPERSITEIEQSEKDNSYLDQILKDKKEKRNAYYRQYRALISDEQREQQRVKQRVRRKELFAKLTDEQKMDKRRTEKGYRDKSELRRRKQNITRKRILTEEQKEMKRANSRNRWATATDEEREKRKANQRNLWATHTDEKREKRNARIRVLYANSTVEQLEKRSADSRKRWATATDEEREKRSAHFRELSANLTVEQMEKRKVGSRKRWEKYKYKKQENENDSSGEKNSELKDEEKEKQTTNVLDSCAKATAEEYKADPQYLVEIEQGNISHASYLGSGCIKSPDIVDKQFGNNYTAKVEQCSSQIGPSDYFEVREDWKSHVKIVYNAEE